MRSAGGLSKERKDSVPMKDNRGQEREPWHQDSTAERRRAVVGALSGWHGNGHGVGKEG